MGSRYVHSGNIEWFKNGAFGLFVHWGIYSVAGITESWCMKKMASEDDPDGIASGWRVDKYEALAPDFTAESYDPVKWAKAAKAAGMKYAVLTTKHHDGYCLFDTKTKDFNSVKIGPHRDLVAEYVEAFRNEGLKVGLYFSLIDWHDEDFCSIPASLRFSSPKYKHRFEPSAWMRFQERMFEQVRELLTNYGKIDLMFFDVPGWGSNRWCSEELKMMMLELQPELICNDRLPGVGDYTTPEQQIPLEASQELWETCMTMNHQWSYSYDESRYKTTARLIHNLAEIRSKGGNLLLNVGPKSDGTFPIPAVERLEQIGEWMRHSGESISGAEVGISPYHFYGPTTHKGNTLYCHLFDLPQDSVAIRGIIDKPKRVFLLKDGSELEFMVENKTIFFDVPAEACDKYDTVVAVEFEDVPRKAEFSSTVFAEAGKRLW